MFVQIAGVHQPQQLHVADLLAKSLRSEGYRTNDPLHTELLMRRFGVSSPEDLLAIPVRDLAIARSRIEAGVYFRDNYGTGETFKQTPEISIHPIQLSGAKRIGGEHIWRYFRGTPPYGQSPDVICLLPPPLDQEYQDTVRRDFELEFTRWRTEEAVSISYMVEHGVTLYNPQRASTQSLTQELLSWMKRDFQQEMKETKRENVSDIETYISRRKEVV